MKKIKTIFSPQKILVLLFIAILIIAIPEFHKPSMSKTQAIVTTLCVNKDNEDIQISAVILAPGMEKSAKHEVFSATGKTVSEAVDRLSAMIGKNMAFAQCEIMAFGEELCQDGVMPVLDYMTRTKKVGRNSILINFVGETTDFAKAISYLNESKSLTVEEIMNFDERYILSETSNIDAFYQGYFSDLSLGLMSQMRLEKSGDYNKIEVEDISSPSGGDGSGGGTGAQSGGDSQKQYIVNDGVTTVFKQGKKVLELESELTKKVRYFMPKSQTGTITVDNVKDSLYNDVKVVFGLADKGIKLTPSFDKDKPKFKIDVELTVTVEEVIEYNPDNRFLRRNKEFLTSAAVDRLKESVKSDIFEVIDFCKTNKLDLIKVYKNFKRKKTKDFNKYLEKMGENYLEEIEYEVNVKVNSAD